MEKRTRLLADLEQARRKQFMEKQLRMAEQAQVEKNEFFRILPLRSALTFYLAVFFTFAPIGTLFVTSFAPQRPWSWWLVMGTISGALAVCWAATFSLSRWFIPGIVVFTLALAYTSGSDTLGARSQSNRER